MLFTLIHCDMPIYILHYYWGSLAGIWSDVLSDLEGCVFFVGTEEKFIWLILCLLWWLTFGELEIILYWKVIIDLMNCQQYRPIKVIQILNMGNIMSAWNKKRLMRVVYDHRRHRGMVNFQRIMSDWTDGLSNHLVMGSVLKDIAGCQILNWTKLSIIMITVWQDGDTWQCEPCWS